MIKVGHSGHEGRSGGPQGQKHQGEGRVETGNTRMTTTGVPLVIGALGAPVELQQNQEQHLKLQRVQVLPSGDTLLLWNYSGY